MTTKNARSAEKPRRRERENLAPHKLKLLFTVVDRRKAEFYIDLLQSFEVNMQLTLVAKGTAKTEMPSYLKATYA